MAGLVVTFYSYKGGVGRTLALANVATLLARWGWRVLVVDFDLEAPGLDRYLERDESGRSQRGGLLDLLDMGAEPPDWRVLVREVRPDETTGNRLHLLAAGDDRDPGFAGRLAAIDWDAAYALGLGARLEALRAAWVGAYDLVLLDSRTGLSDLQGICTAQLPDLLVGLFTGNSQSLEGCLRVVQRSHAVREQLPVDRARLQALFVLSRWDDASEASARLYWLAEVPRRLGPEMRGWLPEGVAPADVLNLLRLPYHARWSLGEPLVIPQEDPNDVRSLSWALANLAALLARRLGDVAQLVASPRAYVHGALASAPAAPTGADVRLLGGDALRPELERAGLRCHADGEHAVLIWPEQPLARLRLLAELADFADARRGDPRRRLLVVSDTPPDLPAELGAWQQLPPGADLPQRVASLLHAPPSAPHTPEQRYRAWLRERHGRLLPFFPGAADHLLESVFVELELERWQHEDWRDRLDALGPRRLEDLLAESVARGRPGRFLVVGDPGAGKTTLLRHLAASLGRQTEGTLPVFVSLARHAGAAADVLALAAADLPDEPHLIDLLRDAAARPGGLFVLLDGLDEVDPLRFEDTRAWIGEVCRRHPQAVVVVTSRPVAVAERGLGRDILPVRVRPLDTRRQRTLLERLLGDDEAARIGEELRRRPRLAELASNPLLLTLLALVGREAGARGAALPSARVDLYRRTLDLLLRRGYCPEPRGMKDALAARRLLRALSLRLHEQGGEAWTLAELDAQLRALRELPTHDQDVRQTWESNDRLLLDLGHNAGVIGPHDPGDAPWRYLHRSLREFLAAEALAEAGDEAVERWVARWRQAATEHQAWAEKGRMGKPPPEPHRWGEVFGLLCGLVPHAGRLLGDLARGSPELALRTITSTDGLELRVVTDVLATLPERTGDAGLWGGDELSAALEATGAEPEVLAALLWARVEPGRSPRSLGHTWCALEQLGLEPDRARFFEACGKALPTTPVDTVDIPVGSFWMGSSEGEGFDPERPRHRVTLTQGFRLGRTPVTNTEYRRLWPKHATGSPADHPAVNLSWYEARLYAAWLGGRLPTEAEWEYACRAGTEKAFSFGDDEGALEKHAWYDKNSGGRLHPVGKKLPNPWGLLDMHGLVLEWCQDSYAPYEEAPQTDAQGPARGVRCLRGGFFQDPADGCRSAGRSWVEPRGSGSYFGFRVLLPAPARPA
jgi:formylglycine-generating enzyme required for sulfatase activity/cellulose biosynthesis protein BcsQ